MSDYCPGAVQVPQTGGGGLDPSMPPRAVWHITWDALKPDGTQPSFSAVANYLKTEGYCPHLMWNPFTGYIEQYYPASQSARALAAWNGDGAACVQVEVFFTPGCVVDGVKYATVADTPLAGLDTILDWLDSLGIPRGWPLGSPQWQGNSRDSATWNTQGGHYGHCNVPDNTHTDPGPMPDFNRSGAISVQGATITPIQEEGFLMALSDQDQVEVRDNLRKLVQAADEEKAFSAGVNEKVDELVGNVRKTFWNSEESKNLLASTPAPVLAAQIDAAGVAAEVRDELVKLLGGK